MQTRVRPTLRVVRSDPPEETKSPSVVVPGHVLAWSNTELEHFVAAALRAPSRKSAAFSQWAKVFASSQPPRQEERSIHDVLAAQSIQIEQLVEQVALLNRKIDALSGGAEDADEVDIPFEAAIALAREYFSKHKEPTYPDELAERIGISVGQAIEVCEALVKEGQVVA